MEKQKCPELRFNGYSEDWVSSYLGSFINSLDAGVSVNSDDRIPKNGEYSVLKTSCVATGHFEPQERKRVFLQEEISRLRELLLDNSIILSRMNTPMLVGMNAYVKTAPKNTFLPDRLWQLKLDTSIVNTKWLAAYLGSNNGLRRLRDLATGTSDSMKNITKPDVLNIELYIASIAEQTVVGEFFQDLDQSIALYEKKLAQTQNFKKAMLEKMFPKQGSQRPEIRLKGFSGDWKKFKLGDIASIVDRKDSESTAPIMMISAASGFINQSEKYSSNNAGQSLAKYTVLQKGELAYNHGASKHKPYGACFALEVDEARIPFVYHCFNVGENNPYFTAIALNHFRIDGQLRKLISSGARMDGLLNISFDAYKTVEVMLPNKAEQDKIYNFFKSLEETLTLQQQKLRTLKNLKQALLEKMFV